jgi:hypothetical protein
LASSPSGCSPFGFTIGFARRGVVGKPLIFTILPPIGILAGDSICNSVDISEAAWLIAHMTNEMTAAQYNEAFNSMAQELGCAARIEITVRNSARYGRKVLSKFFKVTGTTTGDRELMYPIDVVSFDKMLDSYPQLRAI